MDKQDLKQEKTTFEMAMKKLEETISKLDEGSLSLDESLDAFEQGVYWSKECNKHLEDAEERVQIILKNEAGDIFTKNFQHEK